MHHTLCARTIARVSRHEPETLHHISF